MSSKGKSDDFFSVWGEAKIPRHKSEDEARTEKILAEYQREHPAPESSNETLTRLDMRDRMRRQKAANERELAGESSPRRRSWTCPKCGAVSINPEDVRDRHCRRCNDDDNGGTPVRKPKPRVLA